MINVSQLAMLGLAAILSSTPPQHKVDFTPSFDSAQRIGKLWLVTFIDNSGQEVVAQAKAATGEYVPLIAADDGRLESIIEAGRVLARAKNIKMRLIQFSTRSDLADITP